MKQNLRYPSERAVTPSHPMQRTQVIVIGLIAGLVATVAIDSIVVTTFPLMGVSADVSFSLIGDTAARFFALWGIVLMGGVPLGLFFHYLIGPALGVLFSVGMSQNGSLRRSSVKKCAGLGILYTEVASLPLLFIPPILLGLTLTDTTMWFGISIVMHSIYGLVIGLIVGFWLRSKTRTSEKVG